ncbi:unnamed protein product [Ectocarpus sp. 12 AP-2014]
MAYTVHLPISRPNVLDARDVVLLFRRIVFRFVGAELCDFLLLPSSRQVIGGHGYTWDARFVPHSGSGRRTDWLL